MTVPFQGTGFGKQEEEDGEKAKENTQSKGSEKLMDLLFKYSRKFAEKRQEEGMVAGVVGFTNTGKSSIVNVLKGKIITPTGS